MLTPAPSPGLFLLVDGRSVPVPAGAPFVVGRGPGAHLDLAHPKVSRRHLVLESTSAGWVITDHSSNGTYVGPHRIGRLDVRQPLVLRLGGADDGAVLQVVPGVRAPVAGPSPSDPGPTQVHTVHGRKRVTVGRLPGNDVVLDDLLVSRNHAVLERRGSQWQLTDLGSGNGTFVNGRRIDSAAITPADVIGVGRSLLRLDGDTLIETADRGGPGFAADSLTVTTGKGRTLLQGVGFELPPTSLLAVIGPSGAGKSTLLGALTGARPADSGSVHYGDRDLYQDYDELRHRIAVVPQDDVLHTQLTVRQALQYAARLRFPADTAESDRRARIDEVLAELGLTAHADQRISSLSGGQRKRTSVALELLTKPSLLFLDEPTSGLDPGMDRSVMHTLRELADEGRTVVVVTHNVANLALCDRVLVLAPGGWVAYFGPPDEALHYFGQADFAEVFQLLPTRDGEFWATRFAGSAAGQHGARAAAARRVAGAPMTGVDGRAGLMAHRQQGAGRQFGVLSRRYLAVIAADRQYAIFLAALPLVLSLLARAVPGSAGLSVSAAIAGDDPQPQQLLLVLIIGGCLMGTAGAVRELIKERPIYLRERAIGLGIGPYLASKIVVLGLVTAMQSALFVALATLGREPPDSAVLLGSGSVEIGLAVLAVTVTSMILGLAISAGIDNADRGMPLLVLVIMVQLVLCGGLFAVDDRPVLEQLSWFVPARWAFSMAAATADLSPIVRGTADPTWEHAVQTWLFDAAALVLLAAAFTALTWVLLARLDPRPARRRW